MENRYQYNSMVPANAIACLHYASIAGLAASDGHIAEAKEAITEAHGAMQELIGTHVQYYTPALAAAIEQAETEIAWFENENRILS